jgi:VWFA-related protein
MDPAVLTVRGSPGRLDLQMIFRVEPGRRHLIVAITDARDTISALDAAAVRDIAARSDVVLHIAILDVVARNPPQQLRQWTNHLQLEPETLRDAARRTGGELHEPGIFGTRTVNIFKKVFEDFRRSYVLHYTPTGVAPGGWHELDVRVTRRGRYEVRARKGYYAD